VKPAVRVANACQWGLEVNRSGVSAMGGDMVAVVESSKGDFNTVLIKGWAQGGCKKASPGAVSRGNITGQLKRWRMN